MQPCLLTTASVSQQWVTQRLPHSYTRLQTDPIQHPRNNYYLCKGPCQTCQGKKISSQSLWSWNQSIVGIFALEKDWSDWASFKMASHFLLFCMSWSMYHFNSTCSYTTLAQVDKGSTVYIIGDDSFQVDYPLNKWILIYLVKMQEYEGSNQNSFLRSNSPELQHVKFIIT